MQQGKVNKVALVFEALLPESSKPLEPEWASFKQILVMRNRGQPTYFHDSGSEYSISAILGLFESATRQGAGGNTTNINITWLSSVST